MMRGVGELADPKDLGCDCLQHNSHNDSRCMAGNHYLQRVGLAGLSRAGSAA
jgi:hypothetical protein